MMCTFEPLLLRTRLPAEELLPCEWDAVMLVLLLFLILDACAPAEALCMPPVGAMLLLRKPDTDALLLFCALGMSVFAPPILPPICVLVPVP